VAKADGTKGALLSTSAALPVLPAGYTYCARQPGAFRTTAGGGLIGGQLSGRDYQYTVGGPNLSALPVMAAGIAGSLVTPSWAAVSVAPFVPPTAIGIRVVVIGMGDNGAGAAVAPSAAYGAVQIYPTAQLNPAPLCQSTSDPTPSSRAAMIGGFLLEGTTIVYAGGRPTAAVHCLGYWE
jgi:hypothetical protein